MADETVDGAIGNMALQGGEPGGPSSVPGRYSLGEVGGRLRAGSTPVLGSPNGETAGNRKQEERFSTEDSDRETAPSTKNRIAFRSRVAGPNVVSIHEEGGTAGRPTGPCFLALL